MGTGVDRFFSSEAGIRGNLGAAGLGIFDKSLSGIDSFRERY
jgi:hypothetical protein